MPPSKKAAPGHLPHKDTAHDMRRAYEHLGRVEALQGLLEKHAAAEILTLTKLAQQELTAGRARSAADLLRASEHLSFGLLVSSKQDTFLHPRLVEAITREFDHKLEKADEHWSHQEQHDASIEQAYAETRSRALKAYEEGAFRGALEWARGAEALALAHPRHISIRGEGSSKLS